jgi:hypothetical protein
MMTSKALWIWGGLALAGVVAAVAGPTLVARFAAGPTTLESGGLLASAPARFTPPEDCEWLLIVGRRTERMSEDDPIPHRNSRVALYQSGKTGWQRVTGSLPIRSHSTAIDRPDLEGQPKGTDRLWGYASVPLGVFTMRQAPWRDGTTPAFHLADWGRFDGVIALSQTQVLRRSAVRMVSNDEDHKRQIEDTVLRSAMNKTGSWLHPTHTQHWSYGDSHGCMNLYRPENPEGQKYDYDEFLSWFSTRGLTPGPDGDLIPLLVVPFEWVAGSGDELTETVTESLVARARSVQGKQVEELP